VRGQIEAVPAPAAGLDLQAPGATGHLSGEALDLLLLSALDAPAANEAKRHLDGCEGCRTSWRELNDDKQHFEQVVFARTLPRLRSRLGAPAGSISDRFRLWLLLPTGGLIAAGLVAGLIFNTGATTARVESAPTLQPFALRGEGRVKLERGAALLPGDRLDFVVEPAWAHFLLIATRDHAGTFSVEYPRGASQSAPVDPRAPRPLDLPSAAELEGEPGPLHVVAVLSEVPVSAEQLRAALHAHPAAPVLPQATFVAWDFIKP
jgi:hypothetical protein